MSTTTSRGNTPSSALRPTSRRTNEALESIKSNYTREELIKLAPAKFRTVEDGRRWILSSGHVDEEQRIDAKTLSLVLLKLTHLHQKAPKDLVEGVRAVALCLEGLVLDSIVDKVAGIVSETLEAAMGDITESINNVASNASKAMENAKDECTAAIQRLDDERATKPTGSPDAQVMSFADTVRSSLAVQALGPAHQEIFARSELREKMVMIDCAEGADKGALRTLTERILLEKAAMALERIGEMDGEKPEEVKFVSARRLPNGGVSYVMNSAEAAEWVRKPEVRLAFTGSFGADIVVRERVQTLIVQFVPVTLSLSSMELEQIEDHSNVPRGTFLEAKWMKAPGSRKSDQHVGNVIIKCGGGVERANDLIRHGVVVEGRKVPVKKMEKEPMRCLKCQYYGTGHFAAQCSQIHETCGKCAKMHRTSQCKEPVYAKGSCVNCKKAGLRDDHASVDKLCPVYLDLKRKMDTSNWENQFKYYVTNDPATWVPKDAAPVGGAGFMGSGRYTLGDVRVGQSRGADGGGRRPDAGWGGRLGNGGEEGARSRAGTGRWAGGQQGEGGGTQREVAAGGSSQSQGRGRSTVRNAGGGSRTQRSPSQRSLNDYYTRRPTQQTEHEAVANRMRANGSWATETENLYGGRPGSQQ